MKNFPETTLPTAFDAQAFEFAGDSWLEHVRRAQGEESLGEWLGYEVLSPATRGGQAMVYRCRDRAGKIVAVKRIHGGVAATTGAKRRLQRELELASALLHPNIVNARTVAATDELLIESDWIDGRPLTDWCRDVDPATRVVEIVQVMISVCDAVQFAHEQGVIHRDLKPSNILVDGDGNPHVLDFGLAGTIAEFSSDASRVTLSEPLVGTPAYASPEQIGGAPRLDARTDVYSLGVLLYEAFTGTSPYPPNLSLGRLLYAVEYLQPLRPRQKNAAVPRNVEAVILHAMRKDPAQRYATAGELRADLQRCLEGARPVAPSPGLWFDLRAFARRNPTFAWVTVCVFSAVMATGVVMALYARGLARAQRDILAAHHAAERTNEVLSDMIERAASPIDDEGSRLTSVLDETSHWIDQELGSETWALARTHVAVGLLYAQAERWVEADKHLHRAINDYRNLGDPDRKTVAQALRILGLARAYLGLPDAVDREREALAIARRVLSPKSMEIANFHASMAETLLVAGGKSARSDADAQLSEALGILRTGKERFFAWEAQLIADYARALIHVGDAAAAIEHLREASSLFEDDKMPIQTCPYHRACLGALARAYELSGNLNAASEIRERLDSVRPSATSIPPYTTGD